MSALLVVASPVLNPLETPETPEDAVLWASWWAASLLALWFLASVILWSIALRSPTLRATKLASRLAFPGTRKLAEATLALTLMLAPAACTAATSDAPTLSLVARGVTTERPPTSPPPTTSRAPTPTDSVDLVEDPDTVESPASEVEVPEAPILLDSPTHYEVKCGDNLWRIAERQLGTLLGRAPSSAEVAPYWRELLDMNRDSLSSGKADLIFPGEVIALPPGY